MKFFLEHYLHFNTIKIYYHVTVYQEPHYPTYISYITYLHPEDNTCHYYCQHETTSRNIQGSFCCILCHEYVFIWLGCSMTESSQKENLGIVVSYRVKVRLILGFGSGWVVFFLLSITFYLSTNKDFYIIPVNLPTGFFSANLQ